MSPIPYSPLKDDLYFPCKNASFFTGGTPTAEAALCAEMCRLAYFRTSYDPGALDFSFNKEAIASILDTIGFSIVPNGFVEGRPNAHGTVARCFIATGTANNQPLSVVAFRGTDKDDISDVAADADARLVSWTGAGKVHEGFWSTLDGALNDLKPKLPANGRILFTGHSLGAALATLFAALQSPSALYTFGSPLVGNPEFVRSLKAATHAGSPIGIYRYVDCADIVTRVPPPICGYEHAGKPYYIREDRSVDFNPSDISIFADRAKAVLEYPIEYEAWKSENVGSRELADHAPINYVTAVGAAPAKQMVYR